MRQLSIYPLALMILASISCQNKNDSVQIAATSQPTLHVAAVSSPSATMESTATKSPTPSPSATPTRPLVTAGPTPSLPDWMMEDFLFGSAPSACDLPCWQGLKINQSTGDDVQSVFDNALGFKGMRSFTEQRVSESYLHSESTFGMTHRWKFEDGDDFTVYIWLENSTNILKALDFSWSSRALIGGVTPRSIIEHLDTPDHVLALISLREDAAQSVLELKFIYNEGLVYFMALRVAILDKEGKAIAELCPSPTNVQPHGGGVLLIEPFEQGLDNLSPVQDEFMGSSIRESASFEYLFGLNNEDLANYILNPGNTCLYSKPY